MASCAQQVVDAAKARLVAAATAAGDNVHSDRLWPTSTDDLPDWLVVAGEELITPITLHSPRVLQHELELLVAGRVRAVAGMDAALDARVIECAGAFFGADDHRTLGGLLPDPLTEMRRSRRLPDAAELREPQGSEFAVATVLFTLRARFQTMEDAPEAFA